jgi:hypothetical protein
MTCGEKIVRHYSYFSKKGNNTVAHMSNWKKAENKQGKIH